MMHQLFSRGLSLYPALYPRIYMQFAALIGLLIAAEFSMGTLSMMLTQRALYRVSQRVRRHHAMRRAQRLHGRDGCCA